MRRINAKQEEKLSKGKVSNQLPKLNVDAAGIDETLSPWTTFPLALHLSFA